MNTLDYVKLRHVAKGLEKIGVELFDEEEMKILTEFAFKHDELSKTVRILSAVG